MCEWKGQRMNVKALLAVFGLACGGLLTAPLATAQIEGLSVTPSNNCTMIGPEGGPFSPSVCDFSLVNSTAAPITVNASFFINWNPPWLAGFINGAEIPGFPGTSLVVPANTALPVQLQLTNGITTVTNPNNQDIFAGLNLSNPDVPQQQVSITARLQFTASNDNFAQARDIDRVVFSVGGDTTGATKEAGEPNHAGNAGGASLWYRYRVPAAASGTVSFNTNFSGFDTLLAVYTGTALNSLTQVAANDDSGGTTSSAVSFAVTPGQTYYIAIDGAARNGQPAATGFFQLNMQETFTVLNDAFANAVALSGASGQTSQFASQLVQTTRQTGEPPHGGGFGGSVWYRWTAPSTGHYQFSAGSPGLGNFPVIAIYQGPTLTELTEVASNTILATATNVVDFTAVEGVEYKIALAGSMFGDFPVTWGPASPQKPLGLFASVLPTSRAVGQSQIAGVFANMLNSTGETARNCRPEAPNALSNVTPNGFAFITTDAQNQQVGTPNTAVDIPPMGVQNWLLNLTRGELITSGRIGIRFVCDNLAPAPIYEAANTWILRVLSPEPADIIAIGATAGAIPGVVDLPVGGQAAFATAGVNIGVDAPIVVRPAATFASSDTLSVCQTNAEAQCLAAPTPSLTIPTFAEAEVRTFSVFVGSSGTPIAFNPGVNRLALNFTQNGTLVGATSVAVRTVTPAQ